MTAKLSPPCEQPSAQGYPSDDIACLRAPHQCCHPEIRCKGRHDRLSATSLLHDLGGPCIYQNSRRNRCLMMSLHTAIMLKTMLTTLLVTDGVTTSEGICTVDTGEKGGRSGCSSDGSHFCRFLPNMKKRKMVKTRETNCSFIKFTENLVSFSNFFPSTPPRRR